jgi:serine/threonine protein kinase
LTLSGLLGTPFYISPEIFEENDVTIKADIWAIGITLFELMYLDIPFRADSLPQLIDMITGK